MSDDNTVGFLVMLTINNYRTPVFVRAPTMGEAGRLALDKNRRALEAANTVSYEVFVIAESEVKGALTPSVKLAPLPNFGDHMTWVDFVASVACGGFIDYDGHGTLATATETSNIAICPSDVEPDEDDNAPQPYPWATHVVWYNK